MNEIKDSNKPWAILILDENNMILPQHTAYFWTKRGANKHMKKLKLQVLKAKLVKNW